MTLADSADGLKELGVTLVGHKTVLKKLIKDLKTGTVSGEAASS
jgi:hypothetical protein